MNDLECASPFSGTAVDAKNVLPCLMAEAESHYAVHHPLLQAIANRELPDPEGAIRDFVVAYHGYSQWFPLYLQTVIQRLADPHHRELLAENLAEEKGALHAEDRAALQSVGIDLAQVEGIPHTQLFRDFCIMLGITDDELRQVHPAAARWRNRFLLELQRGTPAFCVGALGLGTEAVVRPIYQKLLAGIRAATSLPRAAYVFFELHCLVDDQHQKDLVEIAADLAPEPGGFEQLRAGMRLALDLRAEFWGALLDQMQRSESAT